MITLTRMLRPASRDSACLLWSHVNYEHPYPERERKLALGEYSGRSKSQVMPRCCMRSDSADILSNARDPSGPCMSCVAAEPLAAPQSNATRPCLQVNHWFTNWRARVWKRDIHSHGGSLWISAVTRVLVLLRTVAWYRRVCGRHMLHVDSPGIVVRQSLERSQTNS